MNNDSVYLKKLYCRWASLREDVLSDATFNSFIDSTSALLQEAAGRNFTKWAELGVTNYQNPVNDFRNFVTQRLLWMDANIPSYGESLPSVTLADTAICPGTTIGVSPATGFSYTWSSGDTASELTPAQAGSYSLTVSSTYGCSATDDATVSIHPTADASFSVQQQSNLHYSFTPTDTTLANYVWQFGDGFSASLQSPVYTYSSAGVYSVTLTVTDVFGCGYSTTDTLSVIISGVDGGRATMFSVSPNPFCNYLKIERSGEESVVLELRNISGQLIVECNVLNSEVINTLHLTAGVYFVSLRTASGHSQTIKLVKE